MVWGRPRGLCQSTKTARRGWTRPESTRVGRPRLRPRHRSQQDRRWALAARLAQWPCQQSDASPWGPARAGPSRPPCGQPRQPPFSPVAPFALTRLTSPCENVSPVAGEQIRGHVGETWQVPVLFAASGPSRVGAEAEGREAAGRLRRRLDASEELGTTVGTGGLGRRRGRVEKQSAWSGPDSPEHRPAARQPRGPDPQLQTGSQRELGFPRLLNA